MQDYPGGALLPEIPCPSCGRLNESQREVCWACCRRLSGNEGLAVRQNRIAAPLGNRPNDTIPAALRKELTPGEQLLWHGRPLDKLDLRNIPLIALPLTWIAG